ncbi:C-terminal binding protein [Allosediminivita pacifica]|uniref:D-3-phosphoglycerate dehydrogenase n=1 Tax=Allosediminivita pacifica TaxID=1267769 RepID=A0A2T5ZWA7_9RHOB|nr:C-terminal binding protein [Allosediminivita pacifica]PTX35871.1 D-3-phosphoglycerate dehydrogenase [Allosediminivita pacifica]GGB31002.1 dehydrogenase [Allosediminivita pacifica]
MGRVVVIAPGYACHDAEAAVAARHGHGFEIVDGSMERARLVSSLRDVELAFVRDTPLDAGLVQVLKPGGGIVRYGVGIDAVDVAAATEHGVRVANIPDYGADIEVADQTLALFLAVARRVCSRDNDVRAGLWGAGQAEPIHRIAGRVLGLVGYGRIARSVHRRFAAFGVEKVLVCDPHLDEAAAREAGVEKVALTEIAARTSIVSLHAPPSDDGPLVNADFVEAMRPDAILLNTARGALVDEDALAHALSQGDIAGAGLDVLRKEPPDPANPLLSLSNVVLSDHTGWYSESTVATMQRCAAEEADRILSGEAPKNWVNPW